MSHPLHKQATHSQYDYALLTTHYALLMIHYVLLIPYNLPPPQAPLYRSNLNISNIWISACTASPIKTHAFRRTPATKDERAKENGKTKNNEGGACQILCRNCANVIETVQM
jgi:hypothetical protein